MGSVGRSPIVPCKELHATPDSWRIAGRGLKAQEVLRVGSDAAARWSPMAQVLHRQKTQWVANKCANKPTVFYTLCSLIAWGEKKEGGKKKAFCVCQMEMLAMPTLSWAEQAFYPHSLKDLTGVVGSQLAHRLNLEVSPAIPRATSFLCCLISNSRAGDWSTGLIQMQYRCALDVQGNQWGRGVQWEDRFGSEYVCKEGTARSNM